MGRALQRGHALRTRLIAIAAATTTVMGVLLLAASPTALAAGGVWGVGQFSYTDGVICPIGAGSPPAVSPPAVTTPVVTTPLVSWPVGSGGSPGYLISPITTDGVTDTGSPPTKGGSVSPVVPGQYGFATAADIARYASLLRTYGSAGSKATASLAELIQEANGRSSAQCAGPALDRAYTATLLPSVDQRVGPLTIRMTPLSPKPVVVGGRVTISATVTAASGSPASNVPVRFSSPGASLSAPTATTDATGAATTVATVTDVSQTAVDVQASVDNATKLNVTTAPGAVPAISLGTADTVVAAATVFVDQSANPKVSATVEGAFSVRDGVRASAAITGMNAHAGIATFATAGPLPMLPGTYCSTYDESAFGATPTVATVDVPFTGDRTVTAPVRALTAPGCYTSRIAVRTTNATPPATAVAPRTKPTLGLDSAAVLATKHNGVAGGEAPLEGDATVTSTYGIPASLSMSSVGPVTPNQDDGACTDVAFSAASRSPGSPATGIPGDGVYPTASTGSGLPGCYQLTGTLNLAVPGAAVLSVPVTTGSTAPIILTPGMAATATTTGVSSPDSTTAHIRVSGTYGYQADLYADLYYLPAGAAGSCEKVDWSKAAVANTSTPLAIGRDGEYDVVTGPTPELGCYSITPRIVMRDNPDASFTTLAGANNTVFIAGVDPGRSGYLVTGRTSNLRPPFPGALISSAALFGLAILLAVAIFKGASRGSRRRLAATSARGLPA